MTVDPKFSRSRAKSALPILASRRPLFLAVLLWWLHFDLNANAGQGVRDVHAFLPRPAVGKRTLGKRDLLVDESHWSEQPSKSLPIDSNHAFVQAIDFPLNVTINMSLLGATLVARSWLSVFFTVLWNIGAMHTSFNWFRAGILVSDSPKATVLAKRLLWVSFVFLLTVRGGVASWTGRVSAAFHIRWVSVYL
jgi:hypothetical protein